ncbi:lysozyme family protein [Virgibacillus sp. W0181]|uniref:lysozyme family protein n=1 Tax=Virgibacillus sp. W0181 TaxID=3391581 RepID=UPI003F4654CC
MNRKTKTAIKQTFMITAGLFIVLIGISVVHFSQTKDQPELVEIKSSPIISDKVLQYKPLVDTYAKKYGVSDHVEVLLAMMMQESGGWGNDPMQSSESHCGKIGCINEPALSIKQGVYYFSENLKAADGDLELAIQSYNFGRGFITYANEHTGKYTQELAIQFSREMYEKASDPSIYSCLREGSAKFNACYGDIYYVRDVLEYREAFVLQ